MNCCCANQYDNTELTSCQHDILGKAQGACIPTSYYLFVAATLVLLKINPHSIQLPSYICVYSSAGASMTLSPVQRNRAFMCCLEVTKNSWKCSYSCLCQPSRKKHPVLEMDRNKPSCSGYYWMQDKQCTGTTQM